MKYYVYRHIRLDTKTPFYIGKGHKNRAFNKNNRNNYWKNIVNKHNYKVEIIASNLTEEQAFQIEKQLIKLYKSFGYSEANFTLGGDGISGFKFSENSKVKMSKAQSGESNPMYGKTHTRESRNKISEHSKHRVRTKAEREKLSKSRKGMIFSEAHKIKLAKSKGSKEFKVYKNTKLIGTYINKSECMRDLGISVSSITRYLSKARKHKVFSFVYSFKEE